MLRLEIRRQEEDKEVLFSIKDILSRQIYNEFKIHEYFMLLNGLCSLASTRGSVGSRRFETLQTLFLLLHLDPGSFGD